MFNNLNATSKKILVIFLIITLTYANLILIGTNIVQGLFSYALEETEEQNLVVANQELLMNKVYGEEGEQKRVIQVAVETGIESEEYPIKTSTITLGTDLTEGALVDVKVTDLNQNSYTSGTWVLSEGKLIISLINENETLETKEKGLDKFLITYVFEDSETEIIKQPLERIEITTYNGKTLANDYTAVNFEGVNTEKELLLLNIENKDIHKTTIESGKVDYTEGLNLDLSYRNDVTSITIEDVSNIFYNVDGQKNEDVVLQYRTTTINKEDLNKLFGKESKLVITDTKTNKIVAEITSEVLTTEGLKEQKFTDEETSEEEVRSNVTVGNEIVEIEYTGEVTNIKFELVNIKAQSISEIDISDFVIENTKSILNVSDIENLSYLQQNVKYIINEENSVQSTIKFKDTVTRANLTADNTEWILGEANKVKYTITLDTTTEKSELFVNPMFLIEMPSSVESIDTSKSEFIVNNDSGVFTDKKVFTTTVLGKKYIVITLTGKQTEESIQNGNTTIDISLELNVNENQTEESQTTKLYYQNNTITTYENGTSFDICSVEISLILNNEDKEEIFEKVEETEYGIIVDLQMKTSTKQILEAGETIEYTLNLYNYGVEQVQELLLTDVLPENVDLENVTNENGEDVEYEFNQETRTILINIDSMEPAVEETVEEGETQEIESYIKASCRGFKIVVKTRELEEGIYNKELINIAKIEKQGTVLGEVQVVNTLSKGYLVVQIDNLPEEIKEQEEIVLVMKIENKGFVPLKDIDININLPEEISPRIYEQYLISTTGEQQNKTNSTLSSIFEINVQEIPGQKIHYLKLIGNVNEIQEDKQINITGMVNGQEVTWTTKLINELEQEDTNKPTDPTEPNEPTTPDIPNNPSEPENPNEPENPDNPDNVTENFDLSLTQYLNKITIANAEGTTTYEYKDTNFAKVEIHSKYMNGSKVTLEYKIIVKNEGSIPGYARKIVNYKPEGLEFNKDLNKAWYIGDDGNFYSVELIDKLLNPGETAELSIVLEKQMTNQDGGTIKNIVEIYEASNNEELEDVNSIPGDKIEGQNDTSKVEVIIAVKTGEVIFYIVLGIVIGTIIIFGFYKVKRVTLNKKGGC